MKKSKGKYYKCLSCGNRPSKKEMKCLWAAVLDLWHIACPICGEHDIIRTHDCVEYATIYDSVEGKRK